MGLALIFTRFAMVLKVVTNGFDFRKVFLGKWLFQQLSYSAVAALGPPAASPQNDNWFLTSSLSESGKDKRQRSNLLLNS